VQVWPATKLRIRLGLSFGFAATALGAALLSALPWPAAAVGAVSSGLSYVWVSYRYRRRRALVGEPFPPRWRELLEGRVAFYRRLDEAGREHFEADVRIFLAEQRIYAAGEDSEALDDETRLLVAASAAILGHGMPDFEWPKMRDIVIHPRAFDEDYGDAGGHGDIAGMVHRQGPILYSERDLIRGFRRSDGDNVGLHELAHVLDMADGYADGVPVGAGFRTRAPWMEIVVDRLQKVRRRRYRGVLRDYAGTNEAELFAVAVEVFFERPEGLRRDDPELYGMLRDYFGQDPAG